MSDGLRGLDYILSTANASSPHFVMDGSTVLEKIGHQYHMQMARRRSTYRRLQ